MTMLIVFLRAFFQVREIKTVVFCDDNEQCCSFAAILARCMCLQIVFPDYENLSESLKSILSEKNNGVFTIIVHNKLSVGPPDCPRVTVENIRKFQCQNYNSAKFLYFGGDSSLNLDFLDTLFCRGGILLSLLKTL
jgi:hypothetical protein